VNVLISITHPATAHQFYRIIQLLKDRNHKVTVLVIKKDRNWEVFDDYGIEYKVIGNTTGKNKLDKAFIVLISTFKHLYWGIRTRADVYIGIPTPMMSLAAFLTRKKNIAFCDTERSTEALWFAKKFSYKIITPKLYRTDIGKKQIRLDTFKELFYLHPKYFKPNPEDLKLVGLKKGENFTFVRFVAWNASHDIGYKGFSDEEKMKLIKHLEKYGKVLVSSEEELPPKFNKYIVKVPHTKIHSIMSFAQLFVGDGLTMAFECNVMGIHAVFTSELTSGASDEFENVYKLLYSITDRENMLKKTIEKTTQLLEDKNLQKEGRRKLEKLLKEKIDINEWWVNYLEKEVK